jgi:hypothetical protein
MRQYALKKGRKKMDDEQNLTKPVFELIKENLDPGYGLPADFSIPNFHSMGNSRHMVIRSLDFVNGAAKWRGTEKNAPARTPAELLSMIADACDGEKNGDAIISYLRDNVWYQNRLHGYMNPLLENILGDRPIPREKLLPTAYRWAAESTNVELTRLGLAILSVFDLRDDPVCRELILTLGYFDDFTGYVLDAVRNWPDANEIVFDLARKTHADGKVEAVERLEARTTEIRDWIIKHGCENRAHDGYLALTCAKKGGLITYLKRKKLDDEYFEGICVIVRSLLEEDEMRLYKGHRETVKLFARHAGRRDLSVEHLRILLEAFENHERFGMRKTTRTECASILRRRKYRGKIISALKDGVSDSRLARWRAHGAMRLAEFLKMDVSALLFDLVKYAPEEFGDFGCLRTLYADPEYAAKTTAVYEDWVEKSALVKGMDDAAFGFVKSIRNHASFRAHITLSRLLPLLRGMPLSGVKIVDAGLSSPVSTERKQACNVLFRWRNALGKSLSEFSPELLERVNAVAEIEVSAELKKYYRNLRQEA